MDKTRQIKISKYLSRHLRHAPERLGLTLAIGGWVNVDDLLSACAAQTKAVLEIAVKHKECDRTAVWEQLTPAEKTKFKELLTAGVA